MESKNGNEITLEMKHIVKRFPRVLANDDVSIYLKEGEILALLGENGAGKSTLMNILYGLYGPTSGRILLSGEEVAFHSPRDAIRMGLGMVHQHFMLVEDLTVTENIILGIEPGIMGIINYRQAREEVGRLAERYHLSIDPEAKIGTLAVGLQQRVEILKALYRKARILILDEPTAVLTPQEVEELFLVIEELRKTGVSIIIITHKLEEVMQVSDRVYILRRGRLVGERNTENVTKKELANLMVGRDVVLTVEKAEKSVDAGHVFEVSNVTVKSDKGINALKGLSLSIRPGEIVGVAGVDGNGQTELAEAIMGLRKVESGSIRFHGKDMVNQSTKQRIARKFSYVPADRQRFGLILAMKVSENCVIGEHDREPFSRGINLNLKRIEEYSRELVEKFDIRTPSVNIPVSNLSGGNQQKVILAREFSRNPEFLLISQPTRGLDVGAIEYIHSQILKMRDRDVGILLISLELEEIFALADRILVLYEGEIVREFKAEDTDEREVGFYMTGGKERSEMHADTEA
ncbi:MAG TPA: ABC transporter ATP-binding protein [Spirochaetia bacterium]|nr:ABC transporter ATP-binding protein [Spirochaetia bacterium]